MIRHDYDLEDRAPLAPILVAMASIPAVFVILVATVFVVSCWGGR